MNFLTQRDSKAVYITCHLLHSLARVAIVFIVCTTANHMGNAWILLGLVAACHSYVHDFNKAPKTNKEGVK